MLNAALTHKRQKEEKQDENLTKKCGALLTSESHLFSTSADCLFLGELNGFIEEPLVIVHCLTHCITLARKLPVKKEKKVFEQQYLELNLENHVCDNDGQLRSYPDPEVSCTDLY